MKPIETLPDFLSVDDDEDSGIAAVEGIINSVSGYVPETHDNEEE